MDQRMKRWMDAIDDELLEEAQRPLPRFSGAARWGALAACFCAAALAAALWLPGRADSGANSSPSADGGAFTACDTDTAQPLSAVMALPKGAALTSDYDLHRGEDGAVTSVSCTVTLDGSDYDYSAAYAAAPETDGAALAWASGGVTLLLYDGGVSWYDSASGVEWSLSGEDGGAVLNMAADIMGQQSFAVPAAPEGAGGGYYMALPLGDIAVIEVSFTADGVRWHYRMAPTDDVSEVIPDISEFTGGTETAKGKVLWCDAALRWGGGDGAGCIIWRDIVPGLAYSLTADSGASETALSDMAARVFQPAQDDAG